MASTDPNDLMERRWAKFGRSGNIAKRLLWGLCICLSTWLLYFALLGLAAEFNIAAAKYARINKSAVDSAGTAAAVRAIRLAPWKSSGWIEASIGDLAMERSSAASVHQAIYWASADAMPWVLLARRLISDQHYDVPFKVVTSRVATLSPNALPYQMELSLEGIYAWSYGDDDLHRLWLANMAAVLKRAPRKLLFNVVLMQKESQFCTYASTTFKLHNWCALAKGARQSCSGSNLTADQSAWCNKSGFTTVQKAS